MEENKLFDTSFFKRLRFFILGVLLGTIGVYFIIWKGKKRDVYKWPSEIIKDKINRGAMGLDSTAACQLSCLGIEQRNIRESILESDIDYGKSEVSKKPHPIYNISYTASDKKYTILIEVADSTTQLKQILQEGKACDCK